MDFVKILILVLYIQNVLGFFNPYQPQNMDTVSISWPYYYYPTYLQMKQFHVSLFLVALFYKLQSRQKLFGCKLLQVQTLPVKNNYLELAMHAQIDGTMKTIT